jgi:aspartate racemase
MEDGLIIGEDDRPGAKSVQNSGRCADDSSRSILGVLGGMGPLATAYFYRCLIERTPAKTDQQHLPVVMWSDPSVPDRSAALLGSGPSPVPAMVRGTRWLLDAGAEVIAVPCNTAHAFLARVAAETGARFLNMPAVTIRAAVEEVPHARTIGILATKGTRVAQLYERAAEPRGLAVCQVSRTVQETVVDPAIAAVKAGSRLDHPESLVVHAVKELLAAGADVVIAGCSEIPLVSKVAARYVPIVDSVDSLAAAAAAHFTKFGHP